MSTASCSLIKSPAALWKDHFCPEDSLQKEISVHKCEHAVMV